MPPRFLPPVVHVPTDEADNNEASQSSLNASIRNTESGGMNICTNSMNNHYRFDKEGMKKEDGQSFKLSEHDVKIVKTLGRGASSVVHKAFYPAQNKFVAIKKISIFEKEKRSQLMNDIKALCNAPPNLPGLVQFMGAYHVPESGQISIALEYMDGGSLADVLQVVKRIPEDILSRITAKVLTGLQYLHRKSHMVHRDIKPANILMNMEGEPKITDFGISAFIDNTLAVCHTFLGTVTYMSPERIDSNPYSYPADIWSLGLALYECAVGAYPYDATVGPLQLMIQVVEEASPVLPGADFSEEFRDFVSQCLKKNPAERPTAEMLLQHPYIVKYANADVDVKSFMQSVHNDQDRLDEVSVRFATKYYDILSQGLNRLPDLLPLYSEQSVFTHEGEKSLGPAQISARLKNVAQMNSAFGKVSYEIDHIDTQSLGGDGCVAVHVMGRMVVGGMAHVTGACSVFSESFTLSKSQDGNYPYFVANQIFRMIK